MRVLALIALLIAGMPIPSADFEQPVEPRLIGLLKLPDVVGDGCGTPERRHVDLYDRPANAGPPIGSVDLPSPGGSCRLRLRRTGRSEGEELPFHEAGYEYPAAIVYERAGRWFRIALPRGSAWIRRDHPGDFVPYPALLHSRLDYLPAGWDGRLWPAPGAQTVAKRLPRSWSAHLKESISIELLGTRRVDGEIWLHVRAGVESCGEKLEGVTPVDGWIPAYRPSGETAAWFYSRGC